MKKEWLRRCITRCAGVLPLKNRILLESSPDLACNTYPVFRTMLEDPAFSAYQLTWLVKDPALYAEKWPGVEFVAYDPADRGQKLRAIRLAMTSRAVIFCNKVLWPPRRGQLCLFLGHGTPIKRCQGFYTPGRFCNRWLYQSEQVRAVMEREFALTPGQGLCLGYPRNDALLHPTGALSRVVPVNGRKCIFWLPTFRQHSKSYDSNYTLPGCGLPLLGEPGALEALNETLRAENVLLVLKPHPMQDMNAIRTGSFSNFVLISDDALRAQGVQLYEALADADALMTDYSSVYCDFLLTGKPIALTFDDLSQYEHNRGFVMEDVRSVVKGSCLTTPDELQTFIRQLARGEDPDRAARLQANDYYNQWQDDGSARRVADYVLSFLKKGAF